MTFEQYKEKLQEIRDKEMLLAKEKSELNRVWISLCPFKVGEEVIVTKYHRKDKVFVSHIKPSLTMGIDGYEYSFNKAKKDGTMSQVSACIWYPEKVEKL